jgi:DUF971 family protein
MRPNGSIIGGSRRGLAVEFTINATKFLKTIEIDCYGNTIGSIYHPIEAIFRAMGGKMMPDECWPQELRLSPDRAVLSISFDDGAKFDLTAEFLRVESPSAEVQGHSPQERRTIAGKSSVLMTSIDPVGHYAVRIHFDDGHDSGLFTWRYLYELGRDHEQKWSDYLTRLAAQGLSRDPR